MKKETLLYIIIGLLIIALVYIFYRVNDAVTNYKKEIEALVKLNGELTTQLAKAKNDYMELSSSQNSRTGVDYVEKKSPNDADIEINKTIPKIIINAGDGSSYDVTPSSKSYQTVKNGKVVINEDNSLTLDIEKIVDARFKDRIDAINASHQLELKKKDEIIDQKERKLKITKKQRDFYATGFATTTTGIFLVKTFDF